MLQRLFISILLTILTCACHPGDRDSAPNSRLLPEPDLLDRLKDQKASIDSLLNRRKDRILVLVKLSSKDALIPLKDTVLPDDTETSFNILKDSVGHIVAILESPYSESGDWYIAYVHYFDNDGKTFAFSKQTNFFNSGCTEGVAYETSIEYYDNDFKQVSKEYKLVDEKDSAINKSKCDFPYDEPYSVKPNSDFFTKRLKLNGS
jgi:hypothetical protein